MDKSKFLASAPPVAGIDWGQLWDKVGPIAVQALLYFLQRVQPVSAGYGSHDPGQGDLGDDVKCAVDDLAEKVKAARP